MIYLTYNDPPSGIYKSQVIDVVNYFNSVHNPNHVKLVALISLRSFFENRKKIKQLLPKSLVLPMFPTAGLWKWNILTLFFISLFSSHKKIMARGAFATYMALRIKKMGIVKKVIFDARGAYWAELNEYTVVNDKSVVNKIKEVEKQVLLESDFRLSVSNALVNYWREEYNFDSKDHVTIPCTLSSDFIFDFPSEQKIKENKKELGYSENDIVLVYSGSSAGWQSFELVDDLLLGIFKANANVKLVMLTNNIDKNFKIFKQFGERIKALWVKPDEVKKYLLAGDYGILFRENTITNKVASPVKFAEYLSGGLNIIISESIGDFSDFVEKYKCGTSKINNLQFETLNYNDRIRNHKLAMEYFQKSVYKKEYLKLLEV